MVKRVSESELRCPKSLNSAGKGPTDPAADSPIKGTLQERLAELDCDPFAILAGIAVDDAADTRLRLAAAKELAAYLSMKPRQAKANPTTDVDVAGIIAETWSRPPRGKKALGKGSARRGTSSKAKPRAAR